MAYRSTSRVKWSKGRGSINYEVFPQTREAVSVDELLAAVEIDSEMVSAGIAKMWCAVACLLFSRLRSLLLRGVLHSIPCIET